MGSSIGGASSLSKIVKAFAAAGIMNRVVALFDNDTAAESEIKMLSTITLPSNIVVCKYPDLEIANNYPTVGPTGTNYMNVNGLAGSIELYLGADVLRDSDGSLIPVQWKALDQKLRRYQGELSNKHEIQVKFAEKIKNCELRSECIAEYDWTGLRLILDVVRNVFHAK